MVHLLFLHQTGRRNPLGLNRNFDKISFHPYFSLKDLFGKNMDGKKSYRNSCLILKGFFYLFDGETISVPLIYPQLRMGLTSIASNTICLKCNEMGTLFISIGL